MPVRPSTETRQVECDVTVSSWPGNEQLSWTECDGSLSAAGAVESIEEDVHVGAGMYIKAAPGDVSKHDIWTDAGGAAKPREAATAASLTHDLLLGTIGVLAGLAAWQMLTIASEASVGIASKGFYSKVREERDGLMRE